MNIIINLVYIKMFQCIPLRTIAKKIRNTFRTLPNMPIQKNRSVKLFSALVDMLFDAQHMKWQDGDLAEAEYKYFLSKEDAVDRKKFSNFNIPKERVVTFLGSYLKAGLSPSKKKKFLFASMKALQKWWKMLFISS